MQRVEVSGALRPPIGVVRRQRVKVDLMAVLDNCMFRPLLSIFRLSSRELNLLGPELLFLILAHLYIKCE